MHKLTIAFVLAFLLNIAGLAQSATDRLLISRVALNQTQIAFTYGGKIWLVDKKGGASHRLSNTPNEETSPVFSPDGQELAFSQFNGNDWDVYIVSTRPGAAARRVTMMPEDDFVVSWTPDGREVVFETTRDEEGVTRLYKAGAAGDTLATALPLPQGLQGSISPDGTRIAYNPRLSFGEWRYYRGGAAAPIWIADLKTGALEKLPNQTWNDRSPVWTGDKIYFISDRTGIFNIFEFSPASKQTRQLTRFDGQGVKAISVSGSTIAFVQSGKIHLLDVGATPAEHTVDVTVTPDTSELLPKTANAMRFLEQIMPSASGDRVAFGARGDVLIFNPADGSYKNVTNSSRSAERYPVISPDGKSVAYFCDESGEYQLHVRLLIDNSVKKFSIEKQPSFYWGAIWSPDSKKIVFADRRLNLWIADSATGAMATVDTSTYSAQYEWSPNFSPDSRYLTYAKRLKNRVGTVFIYDVAQKRSVQVTDGVTHTQLPVFDQNGKYLYFASSLNAGTSEFNWGVLNGAFAQPLVTRSLQALILAKDTPSPLLPGGQPNPDARIGEAVPQVTIDFEGFGTRFVTLPLRPRDYTQLASGRPGKLNLVVGEWSKTPGDLNDRQQTQAVYYYDLAKPDALQKVVDEIDAVDITRDGSRILYRKGRDYFLTGADAAVKPDEGKQNFNKMEVSVTPADEWQQMFHESMRIMRDWFYAPNYHGQNLKALENYYASYLPTTTRRNDLNRLVQQMLGSVSISHLGVSGGDVAPLGGGGNRIGLLGADYEIAGGHYRFKKVYRSTNYASANGAFTAPLDRPGVDIRDGDYLLEVDGRRVDPAKNLLGYFTDVVGKPVKITVSANADGSAPRTYTVYPAAGENRLRRANWAENNRKYVEKASGGKLGYIFIENYDPDGIGNAIRGLTGYAGRSGVIIDQRDNGGGITPDYLIEWLRRTALYSYRFRGGDDIAVPVNPPPPVKVMIINESNGSAAETSAFMFKLGKIGPIVGKATYGAGIGPYFFTPRLVDNGRVQLPNRAAYDPDGSSWGIENAGVRPDYDVEITPQDVMAGRDPQLEKAVEVAMARIPKTPGYQPKAPPFPIHPGKQEPVNETSILAVPGSAFPLPSAKADAATTVTGKYAAWLGQFDTPLGVIVFKQEGDKFIVDADGEKIELAPAPAVVDRFISQAPNITVTFDRDSGGKIIGVTIITPNGQELKGKKLP